MGKDNSLVYRKAFDFAVTIVTLYKYLSDNKREFVLSKQILRSGTSIAANIREALEAQSKKDFIAKISIALKEAGETEFWLELFEASGILSSEETAKTISDLKEIIKILNTILITTKKNMSATKK